MITNNQIDKLADFLLRLSQPGSTCQLSDEGLCKEIFYFCRNKLFMDLEDCDYLMKEIIEPFYVGWEYWSGCIVFPVPNPATIEIYSPTAVMAGASWRFHVASTEKDFWSGHYGQLRRHLAFHLADKLREEFRV